MTAIPHWQDAGDPWDKLALGDSVLPGTWSVQPVIVRNLDVKVTRGSDAASIKDRGTEPVRFRIEGQVRAIDDAWKPLVKLMQALIPKRGAARGAVAIAHPAAQLYKVSSVMIEEIDGPDIRSGIGVFTISAIEWVPEPKKKKAQPNKSGDTTIAGLDYPNWQRASSPWLGYQPPSEETDIDALVAVSGG